MGRHGRSRSSSRSYSRSRSQSGGSDTEGTRIHVGDIPSNVNEKELTRTFEKFGPLNEVWMAQNPPCFGFVVYQHRDDAEQAVRSLNGMIVWGNRIRVSIALPRARQRARQSGNNFNRMNSHCYTCGQVGHFARDCMGIGRNRTRFSPPRRRSRSPRRRRRTPSSESSSRSRSRSRGHRRRDGHRGDGDHKQKKSDDKEGGHSSGRKSGSRRDSSDKKRHERRESNADYAGDGGEGPSTSGYAGEESS